MCYRLLNKVFGATRESAAEPPASAERTVRTRSAKRVASVRRQRDQLAFSGFLARLQRRLVLQPRDESRSQAG